MRPKSRECRVKCKVEPGFFGNEYVAKIVVLAPDRGQRQEVKTIVDKECLERLPEGDSQEGSAELKAWLVDETEDMAALVLPQATFRNGASVLVPKTEIL